MSSVWAKAIISLIGIGIGIVLPALILSVGAGQILFAQLLAIASQNLWCNGNRQQPVPVSLPCLMPEDGLQIAADFQQLIRNYSAKAADELLTADIVAHCDGMNQLAGKPLGAPTYHDREELKTALKWQSRRPTPVTLQTVDIITCNTVVLKWTAAFGEAKLPVRGIQILTVARVNSARGWAIKTIDTEFNSLAYLVNLGGLYEIPGSPKQQRRLSEE